MRLVLGSLALVLLAAGDAWLPLEVGNKWTYVQSRQGQVKKELVVEVKEARGEKENLRHLVEGRLFADDSSFQSTLLWADDKGLWMRRTEKAAPEDEALLLLKSPVEKGTWEVAIRKYEGKDRTWTFENLGEELVKVPAGEFLATKVRCTLARGLVVEHWYAKDNGLVRRRTTEGDREEDLLELKTFGKATK